MPRVVRAPVLIVDDDPHFARAITRSLNTYATTVIVGSMCAARAAISSRSPWGGALLDDQLPDERGFECLHEIRTRLAGAPVALIAGEIDRTACTAAYRARCGLIPKPIGEEDLKTFVLDVVAFQVIADADSARELARTLDGWKLTPRELQVVVLALEGLRPAAIRTKLCWGENTYKSCVRSILQKANAAGEGLMRLAFRIRRETGGFSTA